MVSEPPLILAFDTSAARCAAALVLGERVPALHDEPMERGQAERLLPMLEALLATAGVGWGDLDGIAVCTGPGNFTGIGSRWPRRAGWRWRSTFRRSG